MKKVRFGIIGFGAFAERAIMPAIRAASNAELTAIQKRSAQAAQQKAHEYGIPFSFDSVEALVASPEVDAVFIVSSNARHHAETLAAAAAGKHILVEKPMAVSVRQAMEMSDAVRRAGVKLMVGHMLRFSPLILRMKEIVSSGMIGRITYAQSHFIYDVRNSQRSWVLDQKEAGAGPLFDIGIHCLDTMRFILADDHVTDLRSMMDRDPSTGSVETTNVLSVQFSRGTLGTIYTSYETPYRQGYIEFFGTEGSISAFNFTPSRVEAVLEIKRGERGLVSSVTTERFTVPDLYVLEVERFSESILTGSAPPVPLESSLHNQEILELAVMEAQKKRF
ncbi:MAG: Gfo/Idh/MocA family oxidoreductase [Bacteroidetes bacterium]|nr:Gfo/Idh/MocA family oxidoreductase [Bacteroidota bacterium]